VEGNLDHMHRHHGFIIPDLSSVKNLAGLINYISEKVHVGRICLFCEREFKSAAACVAHMDSKGHCKIPWEYEDQIEEFVEYYDFSTSEEADKDRGTMEIDSATGELLLRDREGKLTKRLGPSRQFRSLYRMMREETRLVVDPGMANAVKERSLQVYQTAGILTTSHVLTIAAKKRLDREQNAIQVQYERELMERQLRDGFRQKDLIRNRVAKKNVSVARFAHG
jgi:C2H2 type zinc-finger (2 copies)